MKLISLYLAPLYVKESSSLMKTKLNFIAIILLCLLNSIDALCIDDDTQRKLDSIMNLYNQETDIREKQSILAKITNHFQYQGNWEMFDHYAEMMLKLGKKHEDNFIISEAYNKYGIGNCIQGNNKVAVQYFEKARLIYTEDNDSSNLSSAYENLGTAYKDLANYDSAIYCQIKSLELRKSIDHPRVFNNYMKLAAIYDKIGDSDKQREYMHRAKNHLENNKDASLKQKAIFYNEMADVYEDSGLYDSSRYCLHKVIEYSEELGWMRGITVGLGNLASNFYEREQYDSAIYYHYQSMEIALASDDCLSLTEEYFFLAENYDKINVTDSVFYYALKSLESANACHLMHDKKEALGLISDSYYKTGNYKLAYDYYSDFIEIRDSIESAEVLNNIADLETQYLTKEKEQEIALLTASDQLKHQRIVILAIVSISLLLVILLIALLFRRRRRIAEHQKQSVELQLFRSQMNPHFLFNALGSVQHYMHDNKLDDAANYLSRFASLTRSILDHSATEFVPLDHEVNMIQNYLEIEKMRLNNTFDYKLDVNESIESEFIKIPPMLIQPFIENGIKHGFNGIDYKGELSVDIHEEEEKLFVDIIDNGIGFGNSKSDHKSMSMEIFKQRQKLLSKQYQIKIDLEVTDLSKVDEYKSGTLVRIKMPINA